MSTKKPTKHASTNQNAANAPATGVVVQHRHCFLQALLARGCVELADALVLYRNIVDDASASEGDFTKFWGDVSRSLRIVDLELRTTKYEYDGKTYLAVVNNAANGVAKLATRLTPEQIALFRVTLDEILKTDESAKDGLDVMEALNFTVDAAQTSQRAMSQDDPAMSQMQLKLTSVGAMTKKQKEETIGVLVNDGWLARTRDGKRLVLGPRAFCELRTFILEQAPEGARARWDMNL